ncbi:hypothetical protein Lser_V15G18099 [Lactuca serriola]
MPSLFGASIIIKLFFLRSPAMVALIGFPHPKSISYAEYPHKLEQSYVAHIEHMMSWMK